MSTIRKCVSSAVASSSSCTVGRNAEALRASSSADEFVSFALRASDGCASSRSSSRSSVKARRGVTCRAVGMFPR
eukprot:872132-Rhodomonas_salina.1